jgi:hypothetical protein
VDLDDVALGEDVFFLDGLAVEGARAPDARERHGIEEVLMDALGEIADG